MKFIKESRIAATPAEVFAFHESPGALEALTPPWEKVKVIESSGSIRPGSRVVLETKIGPIPLRWVAIHTEYEPDRLFADRQEKGPFALWYHRHRFLDDGEGGTILRDEVDYEVPLGAVGRLFSGEFVRKKLERMFEYRHEQTRRLVGSRQTRTGSEAATP